jgi:hypothetical protein
MQHHQLKSSPTATGNAAEAEQGVDADDDADDANDTRQDEKGSKSSTGLPFAS